MEGLGQNAPVGVAENRRTLETLRFGCIRLLELASGILVRSHSTADKLVLSHQVWALAQAAEAIGTRLPGLRSTASAATPANGDYVSFTNMIVSLRDPAAEFAALAQLALPELRVAVRRHRDRVPADADELTVDCLDRVLARLAAVPAAGPYHPGPYGPGLQPVRDQLGQSGGVTGPADPPTQAVAVVPYSALPVLPARPGRDPLLRPAEPANPVTAAGPTAILHDSIFRVELCATEICAALLAHHPEAPWGLRYDLAKQVRDEGRHYELLAGRMRELGGAEGDFPILFDVWDKFLLGTNLPERILIEQRIGEGTALDGAVKTVRQLRERGDETTAFLFDYIIADEITHVGNGNHWLRELLGSDAALAELEETVRDRLAAHGMPVRHKYPINRTDRRLAGFTTTEVTHLEGRWREQQHPAGR